MENKKITRASDGKGNKIIWEHKKWLLHLYLYLDWADNRRAIWTIDDENKIFTTKRDPKKHYFQASNSYGFNYEVLTRLDKDYKVIIKEPNRRVVKTCVVWDIIEYKDCKNFSTQWFELQYMYPLSKMGIDIL